MAELQAVGWRVQVVATPAGDQWIDNDAVERLLSAAVRRQQRTPDQPKSRERADAIVAAPMTFNSVNKLAVGIADTLAHSAMSEALGEGIPFLAVPMVNQYLAGHPSWDQNVQRLADAGVAWISIHDGARGELALVESGTGQQLVEAFKPQWISEQLPRIAAAS